MIFTHREALDDAMVQDTSREENSLGRSHLDGDNQKLHEDSRDIHTVVMCTDMLHMDAD